MTYNEEELLANIQQILTDFDFEPTLEASKQNALNKLNNLLFPLKDSKAIYDYQFIVRNAENPDDINITVSIKASAEAENESWDFTITNGNK